MPIWSGEAAVKVEAQAGTCWHGVEMASRVPTYQSWPGYEPNHVLVFRCDCGRWGRGT
jgi:hypothetical protein